MKQFKIHTIILIIVMSAVLSGCSDWLDVNPRSEIRAEILFSTEDGYKSALTGVYISMAEPHLYGKYTTMYFPECLSRNWAIPNSTGTGASYEMSKISNFDYKDSSVEGVISTIWNAYYKNIAQINNILTNLESSSIQFTANNDKLVKGEALGLRAFLHLEVLRYFGPVINADLNPAEIAIPYVREFTKDPNKLVSLPYLEVIKLIEEDLNNAEKELLISDPLLIYSNQQLNKLIVPEGVNIQDQWQYFRQNRFNYYTVLGTKARFYHWIGYKDKALEYAKKVIEATNKDGSKKFQLSNESSMTSDIVMFNEHLFGIHNTKLQANIEYLYKSENALLRLPSSAVRSAFETTVHGNDIRNKSGRYWKEVKTNINIYRKHTGNDDIEAKNIVPVLRLSEIYFIAIENAPVTEAVPYFVEYRIARSLNSSLDATLTDEATVLSRLEKEYRKDFFGEGQMFFFYKKHNYSVYTFPSRFTLPQDAYVVPKPKSQIAFE